METGFLLVAHSPLASAFKSVLEDIFGSVPNVQAVDIDSDEPRDRQLLDLESAWNALPTEKKLILVDTFGATPGNVVCSFAREKNCECFSPLSLPLVMKLLCYKNQPLEVLEEKAADATKLTTRTEHENC